MKPRLTKLVEQQLACQVSAFATQANHAATALGIQLSRSCGQEEEFALDSSHLFPDFDASTFMIG